MEYKVTGKCFCCSKATAYLIGVSRASWKKKITVTGECYDDHVKDALNKIGGLAFGTTYWPAAANLDGALIYNSFHADQEKLSFSAGWQEYLTLQSLKQILN